MISCIFDVTGVFAQTIAFQSDSASFVSLVSFVNIVYALTSDAVVFQETPSWNTTFYALVILGVCLASGLDKMWAEEREQKLN